MIEYKYVFRQAMQVFLIPSVPTVKYMPIPEECYHITRYNLRLTWVPSKVNFKNRGFQTKLKPIVTLSPFLNLLYKEITYSQYWCVSEW